MSYQNELIDICCRMMTTNGVPVTLDERIWMNKLISENSHARQLAKNLLGWEFLFDDESKT